MSLSVEHSSKVVKMAARKRRKTSSLQTGHAKATKTSDLSTQCGN